MLDQLLKFLHQIYFFILITFRRTLSYVICHNIVILRRISLVSKIIFTIRRSEKSLMIKWLLLVYLPKIVRVLVYSLTFVFTKRKFSFLCFEVRKEWIFGWAHSPHESKLGIFFLRFWLVNNWLLLSISIFYLNSTYH
jgi:hypothetical protein